jgi:hypothetical protein
MLVHHISIAEYVALHSHRIWIAAYCCLKGSDKGVQHSGFMGFVHRPEFYITRKHNVPENGSLSGFTWGEGDTTLLSPLEKANLNNCDWGWLFLRDPTECDWG